MSTLSEILRTKLLPWSRQNAGERFIAARPKMHQANMPYGVQLVPHKIQSKRVPVRHRRGYGTVRNIIARWPEAGLQELGKYALVCVLGGSIDYPLGNYKVQCGAGYFIFIPPGIPCPDGTQTYVDAEKSTFCDIVTFLLHPNAVECWSSHGHPRGRDLDNNCLVQHERVVAVFRALMEEIIGGEDYAQQAGEGLLQAFFAILLREIGAERFHLYRPNMQDEKIALRTSPEDFVAHLNQYVQSNLHKPLTLDIVAAEMYLSPAQFTRNVRRDTGQSFGEILVAHRMEESKNLLCNSQWSISSIAAAVGFKSPSYFRNFFKRYVGVTPVEFRKQALNGKNKLK